ncbi:hypothetical protein ACH5RR_041826 [Cinchona calisaya]|uniref:Homeobox-leucine zipper protein n=1 Tax=Cinchona calisaya TaxID=153742 RepID=A0ABD2XUL4_9GENT
MSERTEAAACPIASAWTAQIPSDELELELQSVHSFEISKNFSKRRFNDDQIKSLENMFEAESRPEFRVKQQLANKLGLQPRQVAIWFQNKRARSKSKQIEQEYSTLKASYDDLSSKLESLKKENESLHIQVQRLRQFTLKDAKEEHAKDGIKLGTDETTKFLLETSSHELCMNACQNSVQDADSLGEVNNALHMAQIADGSLTSTEDGCNFETSVLLENSSCNSLWWEL